VFFGGLPFGLSAEQKMTWLTSESGRRLWTELYRDMDLQPMFFGCGAPSMGRLAPMEILKDDLYSDARLGAVRASYKDQRGLWYKSVGFHAVWVWSVPDLMNDIRLGYVNFSEPMQHSLNYSIGLHRMGLPYLADTWSSTSYTFELVFKSRIWNRISMPLQQIVRQVAENSGRRIYEKISAREAGFLEKIRAEGTVVETAFATELHSRLREEALNHRNALDGTHPLAATIRKAYSSFENT
jgi:TRAP-type mannitol/chloroaromatic compound transport system substrate-binding protein